MRKILPLALALASLMLCGCSEQPHAQVPKGPAGIPVVVATPVVKDVTMYIEAIGALHPSVSLEIRPQTHGTLQQVHVHEGDWVEEGTPLFTIDPKTYAIKVREAEAQLTIDQANFKAVNKKLERFHALAQKDLMPQTEWDDLEAQAEKAQGAVHLDDARLSSAKMELDRCTLCSPIYGRVGKIDAHPGLLIDTGHASALATVAKLDPLIVEFTVTEKEFAKFHKEGVPFEMSTLCSSEPCKGGVVTFIDNSFDSGTGLIAVRGNVENSDYALRPGQSVRVKIPVTVVPQAILIPQRAIRYNQKGPYVYVVQDDLKVAIRQMSLGAEYGSDQLVLEGLQPEERIILDGHLRLSPGASVEIQS